ncbi:MAG: dCTP deaminase [Candidatus Tectomicrobia bacterium]|nr:dCTP deaminase [Candidatus Tectomicrobia bacterium]
MPVKSDRWIREMARSARMIEPFAEEGRCGPGRGVSHGLSAYGYDLRLADEFRVFAPRQGSVVDPLAFEPELLEEVRGASCLIPPNAFVLARSLEYFRIPRGVIAIGFGKSTYVRCGIIVTLTPFEPEWEGHATLEISNASPLPARLHAGAGIAQLLFIEGDEPCLRSYADKAGRYQASNGITLACP